MMLAPVPVTQISTVRRAGWRGVLRDGATTGWRCGCALPHSTRERAIECAIATLGQRLSGFYAGGQGMNEWLPVPQTEEERAALIAALQTLPAPIEDELRELATFRAKIVKAESYTEIRELQAAAESIKLKFLASKEIRNQYDYTFLTGEWRIGQELIKEEEELGKAPGGQPYQDQATRNPVLRVGENRVVTIAEKLGNRMHAWRMRTIAPLALEALNSFIEEYHQREKQATLSGIVKSVKAGESAMRRLDSMTAPAIYTPDFRFMDCRVAFPDITDDSVAMIMTDPPYEDGAEPLWRWLGPWAMKKLIPGGSLICYFGHHNINKLYPILDAAGLKHWWHCVMVHDQAQRLGGKFVAVNHKPIVWYVKEFRRGRTIVPDMVYSSRRNKVLHAWGQGEGGVTQWIHQLTEPGELIVDPFCGTGDWGHISCREGRRWTGADIVKGGTTSVLVDELEDAAE